MAAFAELEREMIRERVVAGVKAARADGKRLGRPKRVFRRDEVVRLRAEACRGGRSRGSWTCQLQRWKRAGKMWGGEMISTASRELPEVGFPRVLRGAALVAEVAGAGGSLALMLHAGVIKIPES
jgi:hypothetical protein